MIRKAYILLGFLLLLCSSCSSRSETLPGMDISLDKMNKEVQLLDNPGGGDVYKNNNLHGFQIRNLTKDHIIFPGDYGVRIFTKKKDQWVQIQNSLSYPSQEVLLPTTAEFPPGRVVDILPDVPGLDKPITIRIVVAGHKENNPADLIGAYSDITINP